MTLTRVTRSVASCCEGQLGTLWESLLLAHRVVNRWWTSAPAPPWRARHDQCLSTGCYSVSTQPIQRVRGFARRYRLNRPSIRQTRRRVVRSGHRHGGLPDTGLRDPSAVPARTGRHWDLDSDRSPSAGHQEPTRCALTSIPASRRSRDRTCR